MVGGRERADVTVALRDEDAAVECANSSWSFARANIECRFPRVGAFQIRGGRQINVTPSPGADMELIRLYVEGMMMAALLHQRGFYVLHASAVEIDGRAIAFVGHVGAGKSTMVLAQEILGYRMVTDDNAAIDMAAPEPAVIPAFPRMKVYPAIVRALGISDDDLAALHATQVKRTRASRGNFPLDPIPLDRVYVLSREAEGGIERLGQAEAFIELIRNSVPTRWGLAGGPEQMKTTAALLRRVPVYKVRTFHRTDEIVPLARAIEAHVRAETKFG